MADTHSRESRNLKRVLKSQQDIQRARDFLASLDLKQAWRFEVKRYVPSRTNEQLAYWWAVPVKTLAEHTGASKQEMHEFLCGEYFGWDTVEIFGKMKHRPARTLSSPELLPRKEMSQLFDWAVAFGAQHGVVIPYPNEDL